jgi:hypothetical protein
VSEDSRYQINARIDELQGELKRAEEQDRLNAQELADRDHAQRLAQEAKAKSEANIARIKQALREAGQAYSEAVLALTGDGPVAVEAHSGRPVMKFRDAFYCPKHEVYHLNDDAPVDCVQEFNTFPNAIFNGLDTEQAQ